MKKLAFLFLTIKNPNFPKLWDSYFRGHKEKYSLYIHPKNPDLLTWHKASMIKNLQPTEWGFITRAYMELLKAAYTNPDNYKFVTLSESCVPIQSFKQFHEAAINDPRSWIKKMNISKYNMLARIQTQKTEPKPAQFLKNYARFCLNRDHVRLLIEKEKKGQLEFFHKMHVGDEFFLSVLYPLKNVRDFAVTYDDWDYVHKKKAEIRAKINNLKKMPSQNAQSEIDKLWAQFDNIAKNPKTITNVKPDLQQILKCDSYFYRKFSIESDIGNYWKEIIKYHELHPQSKNKNRDGDKTEKNIIDK